ncbi:MAG: hypothetical protein ACI3YC_07675 [Alloprevotella sp.]
MKRFLRYVLFVSLPALLAMAGFNLWADPRLNFHPGTLQEMAKALSEGKSISGEYVGFKDNRLLNRELITCHSGENFDVLVLGSSHVYTISSEAFPGQRMLNLSNSSAGYRDMTALFQLCTEHRLNFRTVVIDASPVILTETFDEWKALADAYERFRGNSAPHVSPREHPVFDLFSTAYLTVSIDILPYLLAHPERFTVTPAGRIPTDEGMHCMPDGSMIYDPKFCLTPERMEQIANDLNRENPPANYHFYEENFQVLETLVHRLRRDGKEVVFYEMPTHPLNWAAWQDSPAIRRSIQALDSLARAEHISVVGGFDPDKFGMKREDYYDCKHLDSPHTLQIFRNFAAKKD